MSSSDDDLNTKSAAIAAGNLLLKLGFARFGEGSTEKKDDLRTDLETYLKSSKEKLISRPAIFQWFQRNSVPTTFKSLKFLLGYLDEVVYNDNLSGDQKMVFNQLVDFISKQLPRPSPDAISERRNQKKVYMNDNRVIINLEVPGTASDRLGSTIQGYYISYRYRYNEDNIFPITREILRIFRRQKEIRFELWYLRENSIVDRYDGIVLSVGNLLWFIGATDKHPERLRIMHFADVHTINPTYHDIRWGIASSDIPVPTSPDPASCRVFITRVARKMSPESFHKFVDENVRYIELRALLDEKNGPLIERLINNRVTALSTTKTVTPAEASPGTPIEDKILKVNQLTIDAVRELFTNIDWSRGWAVEGLAEKPQ